jgi:hypothetical protein
MKKAIASIIGAVALWACILVGAALAQGPIYTGTLEFTWEVYTETVVSDDLLSFANQCVIEVRQDGTITYLLTTGVPDCDPIFDGIAPEPIGCGSSVPFTLTLPVGLSAVWVRCGWFFEYPEGVEVTFMDLDPPTVEDGEHFWLWDEVTRQMRAFLPLIMRRATP